MAMIAALSLSIFSCAQDGQDVETAEASVGVGLPVPSFIAEVKAINQSNVACRLLIDGSEYPISYSSGRWSTSVPLNSEQSYYVELLWNEEYRGNTLTLARYADWVYVDGGSVDLNLSLSSYDTNSYDDDADSVSNLEERSSGTNPFLTGTVEESAIVHIPRVPSGGSVPTLDGAIGTNEWRYAVSSTKTGAALRIDNRMFVNDGGSDLSSGQPQSRWSAIHDGQYLYLLVMADDNGSRTHDSADSWDDENLNIYLDGEYSHTTDYNADGRNNDFHLLIPLLARDGSRNSSDASNSRFTLGSRSASLSSTHFQFSNGVASSGVSGFYGNAMDVYEFRISLSSLDTGPGERFGMDVHLDDDDDGGDRDSKWAWYLNGSGDTDLGDVDNDVDLSFQRTSVFAEIALEL